MNNDLLHDWTLVRVDFDWQRARVTIELEDSTFTRRTLIAEGVRASVSMRSRKSRPQRMVGDVCISRCSRAM
jgi:hypothetical protein